MVGDCRSIVNARRPDQYEWLFAVRRSLADSTDPDCARRGSSGQDQSVLGRSSGGALVCATDSDGNRGRVGLRG